MRPRVWERGRREAAVACVWQVWKVEGDDGEVEVAAFMHQGRCRKVEIIMATAKSATASAAAGAELQ
jgi:hypothetical protein